MAIKKPKLHLSGDPAADQLLSESPLALLIGLVLDQQIPLEWAFTGPFELTRRLGVPLDARAIADMAEDDLVAAFAARPALHRFPASMARRVQELCLLIVADYDGEADTLWKTAKTGPELLRRLKALPGFGDQKAKIFVALLGKQLGVTPNGWVDASEPFGEHGSHRSIADIDSPETLAMVREHKRAVKAAAKADGATKPAAKQKVKAGAAKQKVKAGAAKTGASAARTR